MKINYFLIYVYGDNQKGFKRIGSSQSDTLPVEGDLIHLQTTEKFYRVVDRAFNASLDTAMIVLHPTKVEDTFGAALESSYKDGD